MTASTKKKRQKTHLLSNWVNITASNTASLNYANSGIHNPFLNYHNIRRVLVKIARRSVARFIILQMYSALCNVVFMTSGGSAFV